MSQPSLDELLATHASSIASLRADVSAVIATSVFTWDDVALLRYVLSFADAPSKAADAIRQAVEWRRANAEMLADAAAGRPAPFQKELEPYMVSAPHGTGKEGEQLFVVRAGLSNPAAAMTALESPERMTSFLMYWKEVAFLHCDRETRARRKLCKQVVVVDLAGTSMANSDSRYFKTMAEAGKLSEILYPQLLGRAVIIHPPAFLATMMALFKPLMSKKQLEKQAFCPGRSAARPSASACPYASRAFDVASLPSFLGGECTCTAAGGCVCARPNAETKPVPAGGRVAPIVVGARAHHDVLVAACEAGGTLAYAFTVEDKGVEFSAWLTPEKGADVPLVAARKHKAEDGRVAGEVRVPAAGTVTLRFDNGYSWLQSKTVRVERAVVEPASAAAGAAAAD